jgi:hypothetical protein
VTFGLLVAGAPGVKRSEHLPTRTGRKVFGCARVEFELGPTSLRAGELW